MIEATATAETTLLDRFRRLAAEGGGGKLVFHQEAGPVSISIAELYPRALLRASQLAAQGVGRGDAVGVVGRNAPEWAEWAWGIWLAGAALVPLPAPVRVRDRNAFVHQVGTFLEASGCTRVVGEARYLDALAPERCVLIDWSVEPTGVAAAVPAEPAPSETALVMCTSGSTAEPKGIRVSHAMLLARSEAVKIGEFLGIEGPVVSVSWLPFYHAGGLSAISTLSSETADRHILPVERFVSDPAEWLRLVSLTRAHLTGGPSSGWAAAVRALAHRPGEIDLSCIRFAGFSFEMVDPDVVERVIEVCRPLGLRPETLSAGYGLSEAGGGTMTPPGKGIRIDTVDLHALVSLDTALPPKPGRPVKRIASCGSVTPRTDLVIGSPLAPLPERHVGEIHLRNAASTDGYVNTSNDNLFIDGWLRTGDLGYVADGELFITGRSKEIIVHLGRNYYPQDIEWAVLRATGAAANTCVAFSPVRGDEGDVIVVLEEVPGTDLKDLPVIARAAVVNAVGLTPREVFVVAPGSIPTAHNGKLQRLRAREMFDRGQLGAEPSLRPPVPGQ